MSHKVFKYPDKVPESQCFATQKEAIQMRERSPTSTVISFEVSTEGSRRYLVTTYSYFWSWYKDLSDSVKNYYEVICENRPSKLYCDIEYKKPSNRGIDGYKNVKTLIEIINDKANKNFSLSVSEEDCLVLEATDENKFSIHLIFFKIVLESNQSCKTFMQDILESLQNDIALFDVQDGSGGVTSCIDMTVYSRNRQFRLFESTKYGQKRPLIVSQIDTSTSALNPRLTDEEKRKEIFLKSLITNCDGAAKVNSYEPSKGVPITINALNMPNFFVDKINQKFSTRFTTEVKVDHGQKKAQDSESLAIQRIEAFISSKVIPGRIWKTVTKGEIVTFYVKNFHFCEKVGRPHTSKNHIFFKFYPCTDKLIQCCFSKKCKMLPDKIVNVAN